MEKMDRMEDIDIQETVDSILGKGMKVVDCEKNTSVQEEEVLLINGCPITLEDAEGAAIKEALRHGTVPHCDLINQILIRAGILKAPVRLETTLSVKSSTVTKESVTVHKNGVMVDERTKENKETNVYNSTSSEVWEPVLVQKMDKAKIMDVSRPSTSSCSSASSCSSGYAPPLMINGELRNLHSPDPTIFGTVASDQTPKDNSSRRSLPQTPKSSKSFSCMFNGGRPPEANGGLDSVEETPSEPENALVYQDGNLVAGPLEALIQHLVPTTDYYPDRAYLFAFLLTARLFIKPHELLGRAFELCAMQQGLHSKQQVSRECVTKFLPHLVQLLAEWTETFPYDFRDERVMAHVRTITQKCVTLEPNLRRDVSQLLQNLLHKLTALERYEEFLQKIGADTTVSNPEVLNAIDVTELCPSPLVLSQQLTHIELERLAYIGPEEFVQAFAKENLHVETTFRDLKKTRNLESYIQWFNRLSYFVATEVCKQHGKKKQRVRIIEYWIEVARESFNIGNFNSLMAIIAGLNMSPVARLKKTWSKVQSAKFSILEHQMDPSSNFSSYRSTLKAAMWRSAGATDERQRIVIPFFSLLVKDLYFLNEGCANKLPDGNINFEKFWELAKQVTEFITWKQVTCPFEKVPKVLHFLQSSPVLTENALALASFECEPPENNHEKERYKSLRTEIPH